MAYQSYFSTPTVAEPTQEELANRRKKPQPAPKVTKPKEPPKPKQSILNKLTSAGKSLGEGAIASERGFSTGIARVLPGGTADIDAEKKAVESSNKNLKFIRSQKKAGKLKPEAAQKITKKIAEDSGQASRNLNSTVDKMPSKKQILAGAAGTAFDIATLGVGTMGTQGLKLAARQGLKQGAKELAKQSAKTAAVAAPAGGFSVAADKKDATAKDILEAATIAASTGAVLPGATGVVSKVGGKVAGKINQLTTSKLGVGKTGSRAPAVTSVFNNELEKLAAKQDAKQAKFAVGDLPTEAELPQPPPVQVSATKVSRQPEQISTDIKSNSDHIKTITGKNPNAFITPKKDGGYTINSDTPKEIKSYLEKHQELQTEYVGVTSPQKPGISEATPGENITDVTPVNKVSTATDVSVPPTKPVAEQPVPVTQTPKPEPTASSKNSPNESSEASISAELQTIHKQVDAIKADPASYGKDGTPTAEAYDQIINLNARGKELLTQKSKIGESNVALPKTEEPTTTPASAQAVAPNPSVTDAKSVSRVYARLKAEHPELTDDVSYESIKLKDEAQKAVELLAKDKQEAFDIAMGKESSSGIPSTTVNIAMFEKAMQEGDHKLASRLLTNRSLAQTRRGQELVAEKGSISDNSASRYIKEFMANKMEIMGKKYLAGVEIGKKATTAQRVTKIVDDKVSKLERQIKTRKLDTKTALDLLAKMECL